MSRIAVIDISNYARDGLNGLFCRIRSKNDDLTKNFALETNTNGNRQDHLAKTILFDRGVIQIYNYDTYPVLKLILKNHYIQISSFVFGEPYESGYSTNFDIGKY